MDNHQVKKLTGEENGSQTLRYARQKQRAEQKEAARHITREKAPVLCREQRKTYRQALQALNDAGVVYAVGSSFARHAYTNIWRQTKDLDIFLKAAELAKAMEVLREIGFQTEVRAEHWLAKAWRGEYYIDLIFGTGNGQLQITDDSFRGATQAKVLGVQVRLMPVEEMIASAAYVAVRDRFDGSEIVHLIRRTHGKLDWQRILDRLGPNRELLLWHLILFDYVYPGHTNYLPRSLMEQLFNEVKDRWTRKNRNLKEFRGSILDPYSYTVDLEDWGYQDQRTIRPLVNKKGEAL